MSLEPQPSLTLYLASLNPGKLGEFRQAASAFGFSIEPVPRIQSLPRCTEDGTSFEENARKKALHYSRLVPGLVFADDSGISVDALGGAPGIYSARYAGPDADDAANNEKLLQELRLRGARDNRHDPQSGGAARSPGRAARYVCVIALAEEGQIRVVAQGKAEGTILEAPRGDGGFGYDPLFYYPPLGKTFAELTPDEKFKVSHRGEAFRKLLDFVKVV